MLSSEPIVSGMPSRVRTAPRKWRADHPAIRQAVRMLQRRGAGAARSPQEHLLLEICRLRSAVASGDWLTMRETNCIQKLARARFVLNEVGAMAVASHFSNALSALRHTRSSHRRDALLQELHDQVNSAGAFLDELIAVYAQNVLEKLIASAEVAA